MEGSADMLAGVPQEMGLLCAVCEDRNGSAIVGDGRAMCEGCRKRKGQRIVRLIPEEAPAVVSDELGAPPS